MNFASAPRLHMPTPVPDARCPECGNGLAAETRGRSLLIHCRACAWSASTTDGNHPAFDPTRYAVFLGEARRARSDLIATLVAELGMSSGEASMIVDHGRPLATGASAIEVRRMGRKLAARGLGLATEPPFPWPLKDAS